MPAKPTILERTILATTRYFRIESLALEFSNGARRTFERLAHGESGGAVLIVPMLDDDTVLLVREYAAGVDRYELGLPKGKLEPGESIATAANREIMEEIGYGAKILNHLTSLTLAPGYLQHSTEIVLARDLYQQKLQGDEPEELEVVAISLSRLPELFARGECTEARSIAALFLTKEYLANGNG